MPVGDIPPAGKLSTRLADPFHRRSALPVADPASTCAAGVVRPAANGRPPPSAASIHGPLAGPASTTVSGARSRQGRQGLSRKPRHGSAGTGPFWAGAAPRPCSPGRPLFAVRHGGAGTCITSAERMRSTLDRCGQNSYQVHNRDINSKHFEIWRQPLSPDPVSPVPGRTTRPPEMSTWLYPVSATGESFMIRLKGRHNAHPNLFPHLRASR